MMRTEPELAPPLQASTPHQLEDVWPLRMIWHATGPIHGVKIPTLARPTQKGCKAGRGPVGRPPPACGGRDLLGTIKKMIQALPEQGQ
ncbi:hypothetical protein AVEN_212041-1 [Araneus ventricosus]|uniref:Uncharacterized protein n=1 Tax=Araneus ventricosus TaxID=182803 RepID=A0A4Y2H5P7_ARAVE|nr:hypothetical protein AVEN_212041-1 [Araneus ventricosus]